MEINRLNLSVEEIDEIEKGIDITKTMGLAGYLSQTRFGQKSNQGGRVCAALGILMGIEIADRKSSWRHLDNEKPGDGEEVIVWRPEEEGGSLACRYKAKEDRFATMHVERRHWLPLPEPPQEKR